MINIKIFEHIPGECIYQIKYVWIQSWFLLVVWIFTWWFLKFILLIKLFFIYSMYMTSSAYWLIASFYYYCFYLQMFLFQILRLSIIGGKDTRSVLLNIMAYTLTNRLASHYSVKGEKTGPDRSQASNGCNIQWVPCLSPIEL